MTADGPCRRAPGHEFALAELERGAGTQFDPDVVAALTATFAHEPAGPVAQASSAAGQV
jgi:HD-GYP domain-containing protein (c-di-GMP phosphodiesterase class II)